MKKITLAVALLFLSPQLLANSKVIVTSPYSIETEVIDHTFPIYNEIILYVDGEEIYRTWSQNMETLYQLEKTLNTRLLTFKSHQKVVIDLSYVIGVRTLYISLGSIRSLEDYKIRHPNFLK